MKTKMLITGVIVLVCSLVLFSAAGFFYSHLRGISELCTYYGISARECFSNESNRVAAASLTIGSILFAISGLASWTVGTYLIFRWKRGSALEG